MKKTIFLFVALTLAAGFHMNRDATAAAAAKETVDPRSGKPCYRCHRSKITGKYVHEAVAGKECTPCHQLSEGNHLKNPKNFGVKDKSATLCYECHESYSEAKSVHGVIEAEGCLGCHAPHNSSLQKLLMAEVPKLCFKCHDQGMVKQKETAKGTAFRDGQQNLHFLHVTDKKIACLACHDSHASTQGGLVRPKGTNGQDAVTITYAATDKGGNCTTSCHDELGYERK